MKKSNVAKKVVVVKAVTAIADSHVKAKRRHEAICKLREKGAKWAAAANLVEKKISLAEKRAARAPRAIRPRVTRSGHADKAIFVVPDRIRKHLDHCCKKERAAIVRKPIVDTTAFVFIPSHIRKHIDKVCAHFAFLRDEERRSYRYLGGFADENLQEAMTSFVAAGAYKNRLYWRSYNLDSVNEYQPVVSSAATNTAKTSKTVTVNITAPAPAKKNEKRDYMTALISTGEYSRGDICKLYVEKFGGRPSSPGTILSDGHNPKYNKFSKLLVTVNGKIRFAE